MVEDSLAGVEAGRAGGMRVAAVAGTFDAGALTAADHVVADPAEVGTWLPANRAPGDVVIGAISCHTRAGRPNLGLGSAAPWRVAVGQMHLGRERQPLQCQHAWPPGGKGEIMPQEPKRVEPKVGAYEKPEGRGSAGVVIGVVVVLVAVLLILWLFTDIL